MSSSISIGDRILKEQTLMKWIPHFSIRRKVQIGLTLIVGTMAVIGYISFNSLREAELKQHLTVIADDLSNLILEIRRYEKNYLLYGSPADLDENLNYIQQSIEVYQKIAPDVKKLRAAPLLTDLEHTLLAYRQQIETLKSTDRKTGIPIDPVIEEKLRGLGKNMVDLSSEIVSCERDQILLIIRNLKTQLISSLGIFIFLGAFLIPFFAFKILRSLSIIQQTTLRIAKGDFRPIAVEDTHDETQRVIEAFNRMVAELEHRQDQLLQAKKLSSLGTLTSGIAHQLNNPLNNISTSCQILLEDLDPHIQSLDADSGAMLSRMLRNIEQEVYRARDIVKGLLEFSREREFCLSSSKLRKVVIRSIELISSQVPPGVQILHDIPDDLCLNIDTQRMQQVFLNLIENSLHAIGNGGGQIRIDAKIVSGQEVVINVEDTGEGIAPEELARIFDPFYTTKEVGSGTGLGLSIVYGIIQKHNGLIEVESKKNEGTRFVIRLPLERVC